MGKKNKREKNKIDVNKPCPCGSGKKYKKCCKDIDQIRKKEIPEEAIIYLNKTVLQENKLREQGIYINYVNPIIFQGRKVWGLGNKAYYNRPPNETFHEFIVFILRITLGKEWWDKELASQEKHFIMKCFLYHFEWKQKNSQIPNNKINDNVWVGKPDGWSKTLVSLAFDVCSLIHKQRLPEHLLDRLKNKNEYQGVRYEIAIAAIFARLDCDIDFNVDDKKIKNKHCEFIATHRETNTSIAVEVKSRHRKGVIHHKGEYSEEKALRGDIGRLLNKALKQNPGDKPFMIFIDLNSPITPDIEMQNKKWFKDIEKKISNFDAPMPGNPDPFKGIFFTNYSYHYQTQNEAETGEHLSIIPFYSKFPLPNPSFINRLEGALSYYGNVPNIDII